MEITRAALSAGQRFTTRRKKDGGNVLHVGKLYLAHTSFVNKDSLASPKKSPAILLSGTPRPVNRGATGNVARDIRTRVSGATSATSSEWVGQGTPPIRRIQITGRRVRPVAIMAVNVCPVELIGH